MNKEDLLKIGLTEEQIKEVWRLNGVDMANLRKKGTPEEIQHLKNAISCMIEITSDKETLKRMLSDVNYHYHIVLQKERSKKTELCEAISDQEQHEQEESR